MTEVARGLSVVALRTPTLPPATHTNTYVVGQGRLSVFDPASPYEDQQQILASQLQERFDRGEQLERIVLTHHHPDHVGGAVALVERFSTPERRVPIVAHAVNAGLVPMPLDAHWADGQTLDCGGRRITATHTPGHAPGHLVFRDDDSGAMIAGDMVAGVGTILIDPVEGDLGHYLASLERMKALDPSVLLPAHGPALPAAQQVLSFYIAHRHGRTDQIRQALDEQGASDAMELVPVVYKDQVPKAFYSVAAVQITAHLLWLQQQGAVVAEAGRWRLVRGSS